MLAQKLAKTLKRCEQKPKGQERAICKKQARKQYGPAAKHSGR